MAKKWTIEKLEQLIELRNFSLDEKNSLLPIINKSLNEQNDFKKLTGLEVSSHSEFNYHSILMRIFKRVWSQFSKKGYGLKNVSNFLNIDFKHHDALEDAIAAGKIIVAASNESTLNIDELLVRVEQPVDPNYSSYAKSLNFEPNENGKLFGEHVVFTGELSMPRKDIAQIAANIGCTVKDSVTKKTTILVIGIQDESKLNGYTKSSKHRKAEEMISNGANITILSEQDFVSIYED